MLLTHMIDKIRPVRDSPPRQYVLGRVSDVGGEGEEGGRVGGKWRGVEEYKTKKKRKRRKEYQTEQ